MPPTPVAAVAAPGTGARRGATTVIVVLAALALFAGAFWVGRSMIGGDATDQQAGASSDPAAPEPVSPGVPGGPGMSAPEPFEDLKRFVERERGLEFLTEVEVQSLPGAEFQARVLEEFDSERDALEESGLLLAALGLIPADLDPVEAQLSLLGDGVLGFYDPATGELVVRNDGDGPLFRSVVVHELTHALDDQHFELDRPELEDLDDDAAWAFLALVEGNARRVEHAYLAQLTPTEQQELLADQMKLSMGQLSGLFSMPLILPQILMSPYDYGHPFVQRLLETGQTTLDATFDTPPTSSEQVLNHDTFVRREPAVAVPTPPAEGPVIADGVLGDLMTGFLLRANNGIGGLLDAFGGDLENIFGSEEEMTRLLEEVLGELLSGEDVDLGGLFGEDLFGEDLFGDDALGDRFTEGSGGQLGTDPTASGFGLIDTPEGWGGDAYVLWDAGGGSICVRVDWMMDTDVDLAALRGELRSFAAADPAASVTDPTPDSVRLTRCT